MKKKATFIVIIVIALLIILTGGYLLYKNSINPIIGISEEEEPDLNSYEGRVKALTKTFPTDIMVYGEDVDFGDKIKARKIDDLKEETLMQNKDCRFRFLVINDRSGNVDISVEEYKKLKDILFKNEISIYYVGTTEVEKMTKAEIIDGGLGSDEMLGFGNHISTVPGNRVIAVGFWTTKSEKIYQEVLSGAYPEALENVDILGDSLLEEFVDTVRRFA